VYRMYDGTWYVRNRFTIHWGMHGDIPVPGDYDGDGLTDFALYRPWTNTWFFYQLRPQTAGWVTSALTWGIPGDIPVAGDFNGDGTTDVAVFRPSTREWLIRNQFTVQWGAVGDMLASQTYATPY